MIAVYEGSQISQGHSEKRPMFDTPKKTARLLGKLERAVPFEVELAPSLVAYLQEKGVQEKGVASANARRHSVESVTYAGAEGGGILCRIITVGTDETLVVSLTQVKVALSRPFGLS